MADEEFENVIGDLDQLEKDLKRAVVEEVHATLKRLIRKTVQWIQMGAPSIETRIMSSFHPDHTIRGLSNEIVVYCMGEAASIYGDATRRMTIIAGREFDVVTEHREIVADVAKLLELEILRRLEKT